MIFPTIEDNETIKPQFSELTQYYANTSAKQAIKRKHLPGTFP